MMFPCQLNLKSQTLGDPISKFSSPKENATCNPNRGSFTTMIVGILFIPIIVFVPLERERNSISSSLSFYEWRSQQPSKGNNTLPYLHTLRQGCQKLS